MERLSFWVKRKSLTNDNFRKQDIMPIHQKPTGQTSEPRAICVSRGKTVLAEENASWGPWEFSASLLVDSCRPRDCCPNSIAVAAGRPQPDKETDRRTRGQTQKQLQAAGGGRRGTLRRTDDGWFSPWPAPTSVSYFCVVKNASFHFLRAQPCLSVSHT